MLILGAVDDRRNVTASIRLLVQAGTVLLGMIALGGLQIESLGQLWGNESVALGAWKIPFTVFAVIGVINAINMIDGMDGLAGGFALLVLALFASVLPSGGLNFSLICIALGCIAGFLAFNLRTPWRSQASIFLGDAGSLALGFLLTWFAVELSQGNNAALSPVTMIWVFGLPLMDTSHLMISRALRGQNPMKADRNHFHHALMRLGLSPAKALYAWLAVAATLMGLGMLGEQFNVPETTMALAFLGLFVFYMACMALVMRQSSKARKSAAGFY